MKRNKVVAFRNLPSKPLGIVWSAALVWLYCNRFHAPAWLLGALACLFLIILGLSILGACIEIPTDPFSESANAPAAPPKTSPEANDE